MVLPITASGFVRILLSSFVIGIALASWIPGQVLFLLLGVLFAGVFIVLRRSIVLVALVVVCLGVFRYQLMMLDQREGSVAAWIGSEVAVEGVVFDDRQTSGQLQSLTLSDVRMNGEAVRSKVLARVPRYPEFSYGDRLRLSCALSEPEPFDGFRYDRYLAKEGVLAICQSYREPFLLGTDQVGVRGRLLAVKGGILERIRLTFHEPYAALLEGLLLGEKRLPDSIEEDFRRAGLSHIVAASGQNVALVTEALFWLLIGIGFRRRGASVALLVGIVFYVLLAGADAAIVRAGMMGSVVVLARALGRVPSSTNLLLFALSFMLLHNPLLLRDDVGFQLSFAATTGIVVLQPRLARFFAFLPRALGLREALATSASAIAATLPVMLLSFGELSFVAPLANLLVLPLIPFVMIVGAVILMVSAMAQPLALVLAAPVVGGLKIILGSAHIFSNLPFAAAGLGDLPWLRVFFILAALWLLKSLLALRPASGSHGYELSIRYFTIVGALLLVPMIPDLFPRENFRAQFFSVGQGDATMMELPSGERWLIDGGPDESVLVKLGQVLPWYDRRVDVLVPTHADADHITGFIEVSRRYDIGRVYFSADDASLKMRMLQNLWQKVPVERVARGDDLSRDDVHIAVLGPPEGFTSDDRNDLSVVLLVTYEDRSFLLTGDASQEREREFLSDLDHVDVYKAGHHGSYTSTSYELIKKITPSMAVVSSGVNNRYGHPHGIVLERLNEAGALILRTDTDGDIEISVDEKNLGVKVGRWWY